MKKTAFFITMIFLLSPLFSEESLEKKYYKMITTGMSRQQAMDLMRSKGTVEKLKVYVWKEWNVEAIFIDGRAKSYGKHSYALHDQSKDGMGHVKAEYGKNSHDVKKMTYPWFVKIFGSEGKPPENTDTYLWKPAKDAKILVEIKGDRVKSKQTMP